MKTITFEDHGQDFLEFDIRHDGYIVDSRPFQKQVWTNYICLNHDEVKVGDKIIIRRRGKEPIEIKYPITGIKNHG